MATAAGPCGPARAEADVRCADAERLRATAQSHHQALRDARSAHSEASRLRESDARLRDRRRLAEEKNAAQVDYRAAVVRAVDRASLQDAAAAWMTRLHLLNRQSQIADLRADSLAQSVSELERTLPGLELAADAARISAEAAQVGCLESRRALAACEEDSQRRASPAPPGAAAAVAATAAVGAAPAPTDTAGVAAAARALMRGDHQALLGLALRLAEETGIEAGRLQLLLLELREQIANRALEQYAFGFPASHPFWGQFPGESARNVAASLASIGYRFDGAGAWTDGHSPQIRDLAVALSHCGYDPRSLRRPAAQAAIDGLWQGTVVRSEEYLIARAPDLALPQIVAVVGPPSGHLAELWDIWGRLRPLLMRAT